MSFSVIFFVQKFNHKEVLLVFSDELLSKIFAQPELQELDCETQSDVVHAIERVMEEDENADANK